VAKGRRPSSPEARQHPAASGLDRPASASPAGTRLTIRDVARAAGVSPATVSRALRGFGNVDEQTRKRIVALAHELNYAVSPAASRLATGRTGTIGIVTPYVGRWYFTEVFAGVEEGLKQHDVDLLLHVNESLDSPQMPRAHIRMRRRVDGALVIGLSPDDDDIAGLAAMDVPVVLLGAASSGFASVRIDDRAGARCAVEHLVQGGHERIGVITGRQLPTYILPENDRIAGYLDVMQAHGLPAPPELRAIGGFTTEGGDRAMTQLLALDDPPTAVFSMSDEMAYGALRALRRAGIRAGGDREAGEVALVGFDGHDLAEVFDLSTVSQPVRELGRAAAELLMAKVAGTADADAPDNGSLVLPTALVVRASTRCPASARQITDA
jgi:DNA-binding LacI/PurR family transcriptional regulator